MHDVFIRYIKQYSSTPLSDEDVTLIKKTFVPFRLRKRQFQLQAGNYCKHFAFIVKGAMRMYSVDDRGIEHIVRLGVEDWWMGDRESFVNQTPSRYHIDAWEHCELLYITKDGIDLLQKMVPAFGEMRIKLDERNIMANNHRLTSAISLTADKRFSDFITCYPELNRRFPQHVIASYIGVNKDTLSRVKRLK